MRVLLTTNCLKALTVLFSSAVASSLTPITSSSSGSFAYTLGNGTYYSPAEPILSGCPAFGAETTVLPMTVFRTEEGHVTAGILDHLKVSYSSDDVWTTDFLEALTILMPSKAILAEDVGPWLQSAGVKYLLLTEQPDTQDFSENGVTMFIMSSVGELSPGPYALSIGPTQLAVHQAYQLHRDRLEAFLFGVTSLPESRAYAPVDLMVSPYQDAWITVPSKLHWLGDERPLASIRVALKDIYDLEGVKTGGGSRSYTEVYGPSKITAPSIQKLLDLGAVVIGKTKTSQFAHGADPWQFIDIHYPWNPRGDGYLTAVSSSSGSAATIAGYDWVDIAIGSDTRGSVRKPAALVGSYGIRPTWNSMDLSGVIPLATRMDTAGFFARDPNLFDRVSTLWFQDSPVPMNLSYGSGVPKRLLYPVDYFPLQNPKAQELFEGLMSTLEEELGMAKVELNFTRVLNDKVANAAIRNVTSFQLGSNRLAEYISYQKVGKPLARAWDELFPGAGFPPLDPNPRAAFQRSVNLTEEDYDEAVEMQRELKAFFTSEILRPDPDTCSDGIMILDMGTGGLPSYRQQDLNASPGATTLTITQPGQGLAVPGNYLASMAHCPQVGFPVGQVSYDSRVSLQEELMPVNVDLVAAPGCDGLLLSIVKRLAAKGHIKAVKTGKTAF
ncbi:hypothetical protein NLU13_5553 [Sarocladium strictum]|uniref:Amidase domain-containing protein n=1 Tax=Sarocladium strictum TaxID=5046 RepID=A0AA39GH44_SARSR|nr:hypothetical protein NLU13_5553 [Sarocladium strictum]